MVRRTEGELKMVCPFEARCPMFKLFKTALLEVWKGAYCHGQYETCERFNISSGGEVPGDRLLPDGTRLETIDDLRRRALRP